MDCFRFVSLKLRSLSISRYIQFYLLVPLLHFCQLGGYSSYTLVKVLGEFCQIPLTYCQWGKRMEYDMTLGWVHESNEELPTATAKKKRSSEEEEPAPLHLQ